MSATEPDPTALDDPWTVRPEDFPVESGMADKLRFLLNYAVLAPSGHNSQPWLFRVAENCVDVLADRSRRLNVVDPEDRELTMSCAAAGETLAMAAHAFGFAPDVVPLPNGDASEVIARITVAPRSDCVVDLEVPDAIVRRRTTRQIFQPDPLPEDLRIACLSKAQEFGISVIFAGDEATLRDIAKFVAEGDRIQFNDPAFRRELAGWIRARHSGENDGISGAAFGLPDALSAVGAFMIRTFDIGGVAASGDARLIREGSPAFMVLASPGDTPSDWVATGRALASVLICLSAEGWTASYLNQPIEVPDLRAPLKASLGIETSPQLLLRVGRGKLPAPSARRPVRDVLRC